jgi:hypothetical protein
MAQPDDVRRRQRGSSKWRQGLVGPKPDEPIDLVEWQAYLDRQRQESVKGTQEGLDTYERNRRGGSEPRRRRKLQLPELPPPPDMSLPVPATAKRLKILTSRADPGRYGKGAWHSQHEPYPYYGQVDPGYLMRYTTGPIPTEEEVLRQLEEYASVTGDPLMAFRRRRDEELAVLREEHAKRMLRRTPLTSRGKK